MKKIMTRITVFAVAVMMLLPMMTIHADAASSIIISTDDKVNGGDTFSVNVIFDGDNIGRVSAGLSYDTDNLTYISGGSSQGNSGYVALDLAGTGEAITFNLKFQAIKDGQTSLSVETNEMYNLDEMYMSDRPSASKTITISGSAADNQVVTQETSPDEPEEMTEPVGVDEMEPRDSEGGNITAILIILAIILVLLIAVISIVLARKKKSKKTLANKAEHSQQHSSDDKEFADEIRKGRSGRPLEPKHVQDGKEDKAWLDELMGSGNVDRHRDYSRTARMKAKEETEVFSDWELGDNRDDDYDDIDKW